jgi:SMI1 / KNR4 family (SUKH-1)
VPVVGGPEQYPIRFKHVGKVVQLPPATEEQLAQLEARFGPLPRDYRRFLATVNGGVPVPGFLDHPTRSFEIECFNGLGAPYDAYSVESRSRRPGERLGRPVVAIAGNGAGDQLILRAPSDAAIYQWLHDEDIEPVRMAPSFTALLSVLVPGPEDI